MAISMADCKRKKTTVQQPRQQQQHQEKHIKMRDCLVTCGEAIKIWTLGTTITLLHEVQPSDASTGFRAFCCIDDYSRIFGIPSSGTYLLVISWAAQAFRNIEHQLTLNAKISSAVLTKTGVLLLGCTSGELLQWDFEKSRIIKAFTGHDSEITCLAVSADNNYIASGSMNGNIIVHNIVSRVPTILKQQPEDKPLVRAVSFSNHKQRLLGAAFEDGSVLTWDINRGVLKNKFLLAHKAPAMDLLFSPTNPFLLASVGLDKKTNVYDVRNSKLIDAIGTEHILRSLTFTVDGNCILVGTSKGQIICHVLRTGEREAITFTAHRTAVLQTAIFRLPTGIQASSNTSEEMRQDFDVNDTTMDTSAVVTSAVSAMPSYFNGLISPLRADSTKTSNSSIPEQSSIFTSAQDSPSSNLDSPFESTHAFQRRDQHLPNTPVVKQERHPIFDHASNTSDSSHRTAASSAHQSIGAPEDVFSPENLPNKGDNRLPSEDMLCSSQEKMDASTHVPMSSKQFEEFKSSFNDAIADMRHSTHREYMHLLTKMVKFNVDLHGEIGELREECAINKELVEEVLRLREENVRLRAAF